MRGRFKRKDAKDRSDGTGLSPLPGETAAGSAEPHTPVPGLPVLDVGGGKNGARCSIYDGEKVYLGVRVKMPVKDLLRNIRVAQGQDFQEIYGKAVKGEIKRAKTRTALRTTKKKRPTKSLEELAIIVEVLEEDLRTSSTYHSPPQPLSSSNPPVSPEGSPAGAWYNSDESDEMIPSPQSYMTYSPGPAEFQQALRPPGFMHASLQPSTLANIGREEQWFDPQNSDWNLNSSAFFCTQLQKEERQLRDVSDDALLATDGYGRTALHKVACVGKRAVGYAIAKRLAALNSLDLKDSDGMTALLLAAKHNHHLMVSDLICLGADVNATSNSGKSCLHLSAEKGYIRVLEGTGHVEQWGCSTGISVFQDCCFFCQSVPSILVHEQQGYYILYSITKVTVLKHTMMDGVYVDVEATDNSGMSVLQCASVALKAAVRELKSSKSPNHTRLHTLRQEQMMETLECLLQMGSYRHTMESQSMQPRTG